VFCRVVAKDGRHLFEGQVTLGHRNSDFPVDME
jgi:hypothetical protein